MTRHVREAKWMDETGRTAAGFAVVDRVELGDTGILILAPWNDPDRWYAVPVDSNDGPLPDDSRALMDARIVDAMREGRIISTRGGTVVFRGDPPPFRAPVPFDRGWSTNAVSALDLGGVWHVHKRYHVLSPDVYEPIVLRRLRGTGCLPEYVGDYAYVSSTGVSYPLGLLYRHIEGAPLEEVLRANLRTLWTNLSAEDGHAAPTARHVHKLAPVLTAAGAAIRTLHRAFATRIAPCTEYVAGSCLDQTRDLLATVIGDVLGDDSHPATVQRTIAAALRETVAALPAVLAATPPPPHTAGVSHGDLHLSHLVCQPGPDDSWAVRAIDVSSAAIDPAAPGFASQSPWQDLVAVHRGLESFAGHEAAVESARVLGAHRRETCLAAVHDAAGTNPGGSDTARTTRLRLFAAADLWSDLAIQIVLDGYGGDDVMSTRHPLWRLFYTRRMLHELAYNYAHRRAYQVHVDLRRAATPHLPAAW